jgi:aldose 1-epimerase
MKNIILYLSAAFLLLSCHPGAGISVADWGVCNGESVKLYTLKNRNGMEVQVTDFGATVTTIKVADKQGKATDVVPGYATFAELESDSAYFGPVVGRYANRIKDGKFVIDGKVYQLSLNENDNHIHGGFNGFGKKLWSSSIESVGKNSKVVMTCQSLDGEEGYPGNLTVKAEFSLNDNDSYKVVLTAKTDSATIVNLTPHMYFNLNGHNSGTILNHQFKINADRYTVTDEELISTGELASVTNTPFDFQISKSIGDDIFVEHPDILNGGGYDHNWVVADKVGEMNELCILTGDISGITMSIVSNQPGLQFYAGNFLDGSLTGKENAKYGFRELLVLEPQIFPDSPNHENFPNSVLRRDEVYRNVIIYTFK